MRGYVVVIEGDESSGFSAYAPQVPGCIAAGETRGETEVLMREALALHLDGLRDMGEPVPEPTDAAGVTLLDPAAA